MSISNFAKEWHIHSSDTILLNTGDTLEINAGSGDAVSFDIPEDTSPGPWENVNDARWLQGGGDNGHLHGTIELSPGLSLPFSITHFAGPQKNWIKIRLTEQPDMTGTVQVVAHDGPQ